MGATIREKTPSGEGIFSVIQRSQPAEGRVSDSPTEYIGWSESENLVTKPGGVIRYSRVVRPSKQRDAKSHEEIKVLRRWQGFLLSVDKVSARVELIQDGKSYTYDLPADRLVKSGIKIQNQPFEMDEVEIRTNEGFVTGHRFRALAEATDVYIEHLDLDEDRKRKRDFILKKLGKPKT